jgi:hypothetical protein
MTMYKLISLGSFAALLTHSAMATEPSLGAATFRLALALVLMVALVPVVKEALENFIGG